MSFPPRRSSFSGSTSHPLSPSSVTSPPSFDRQQRPRSSFAEFRTGDNPFDRATSPVSPSETIRPRSSYFTSPTSSIDPPSRPIPISPRSSLYGTTSYLAQRQSNLEWALAHNDVELIRAERAAIERYKQSSVDDGSNSSLGNEASISEGTGSIESFEIPIKDTSQAPTTSGIKFNTGRRLSCLANYTGLAVPAAGESSVYSVALEGGGGGEVYPPIEAPPSLSSIPGPSRRSSKPSNIRRPPSPYPTSSSSGIIPLSPVCDAPPSSPIDRNLPLAPASTVLNGNRSESSENSEGKNNHRRSSSSSSASPSPNLPPTRVIYGFHINSSSSRSSSPFRTPSPHPTSPNASSHSICRGRAASVSYVGGLGGGNAQQERMELQASRDIEVLDRERERLERREARRMSREVSKNRGRRSEVGKIAAAERLKKGYSGEH
ncbi:uncharacterized protein JCM6883_007616 [Sporobolomyces salmoneus]|uniref:uncharacterized protein n=1 Tax=Sporobolomyces salmoneus TaxID=183962 RepID=UPI0031737700